MKPRASWVAAAMLACGVFVSSMRAEIITRHSDWQAQASSDLTTITFEDRATGAVLTGSEYAALGLTILQRDGHPILVVAAGDGSYAQAQNFNSPIRGIASNAVPGFPFGYDNSKSDNYDFVFASPTTSAGLWVGNLNPGMDVVTVQFLDGNSTLIDSLLLSTTNPDVVGSPATVDNRLFVGLHSATAIDRIRVLGANFDLDGNTFDDVVFVPSEVVPEPSSFVLLAGCVGLTALRWMRRTEPGAPRCYIR